ncbi:unnamed protein product [Brassica oleracea var. botrytis]
MALVRSLFSAKKILSRATSAAPKGFLAVYIVFLCHLIDTIMAIHVGSIFENFNLIIITSNAKIQNQWKLMRKLSRQVSTTVLRFMLCSIDDVMKLESLSLGVVNCVNCEVTHSRYLMLNQYPHQSHTQSFVCRCTSETIAQSETVYYCWRRKS